MPSRRLEDKIRHVCTLATVAKNDDAWLILSELRVLLRQHVQHLRLVAAGKLSGAREFIERRAERKSAWNQDHTRFEEGQMILVFPRFPRIPLEKVEAKLAEQEKQIETELEEVTQARESLRAIRAANGPEKAV